MYQIRTCYTVAFKELHHTDMNEKISDATSNSDPSNESSTLKEVENHTKNKTRNDDDVAPNSTGPR
jgi:hypothetical protein